MKDHIETLTDLLLGAAYADKHLEGKELDTIRALLERVTGESPLPESVEERIKGFNPAKLDAHAAAASLSFLREKDRRTVADLVAYVTEADGEIDLSEDDYLRKVATGLGLSDEVIKELTVEIIADDDLDGLLEN